MKIERVKYILWAADMERAESFYVGLCGAEVVRKNPAVTELRIGDAVTLSIRRGSVHLFDGRGRAHHAA